MGHKNYTQGIYEPLNKKKYTGSYPIVYRSSLEKKVFYLLDKSPKVSKWGSESVVIPYKSPADNKVHRYFVDVNFTFTDSNGKAIKYLIEIKPFRQTLKPEKTPRKREKTFLKESYTWAINQAKWQAADAWARKNGYMFKIITEKDMMLG